MVSKDFKRLRITDLGEKRVKLRMLKTTRIEEANEGIKTLQGDQRGVIREVGRKSRRKW